MLRAIDFFCGAGGATTGIASTYNVLAAINHDADAIECHADNHPGVDHYNDDVRKVSERDLARRYGRVDALWWSAECTHFSNAKGGQSRDADSRMLNDELFRFVDALKPTRVYVENVREFLTWGPLVESGDRLVADPDRKGEDYRRWVRTICGMGYRYDYRILNAADYGAHTSRARYFGVFTRTEGVVWPTQTHAKNPSQESMYSGDLRPWRTMREILDLDDWGESIFTRRKPLADATLRRIGYGIDKYAPEDEREHLQFLISYYGNGTATSTDQPLPTITTKDRFGLVTAQWIDTQYGAGRPVDLDRPSPTITTNPKINLVTTQFLDKAYGGHYHATSLDSPCPTITTTPHERLVTTLRHGDLRDIRMRMLTVDELRRAQGFPDDYRLPAKTTLAKKFIGNSVPPLMAEALAMAQHAPLRAVA